MEKSIACLVFLLCIQPTMYGDVMDTCIVCENCELPKALYKVLTKENWDKSLLGSEVILNKNDEQFIHFSLGHQIERVVSKYFKDGGQYVILNIDPSKLRGRLIFEANTGGDTKYYHLYEGSIPIDAVVEASVFCSSR